MSAPMSAPVAHPLKPFQVPADSTLRGALWVLGALAVVDCGVLLFQSRLRPAESGAPAEPVRELMIQPRLETPSVRAPWQQMLEEARSAAARGQTAQALRILADTEPQLPQLPFAIAELAAQFEKLGATDRAVKLWERVYQYGASAGVYFSTAEAKLRLLGEVSAAESAALTPTPLSGRSPLGGAPALPAAPVRFGKFTLREAPDGTSAKRHFVLSVPIHKSGPAPVEAKDIDIEVQFYDLVHGKSVERTNGFIQWKWVTNAMNWSDNSSPNVLEVEFRQGAPRKAGENRAYLGYVASVYYREKLQDYRSDPPRLGQQYPPPRQLPKEAAP